MGKLKVMHVLCMSSYSGAENVAITMINSLKDKVDSIYVSPDGSIREVVEQNGIRHYAVEKVNVSSIKKAIKEIKPDMIHAHDFTAGTVCAAAAGNIPVINHLHNNPPWIKKFSAKAFIYGLSCFKYKKILTVSDAVMDEYIFGKFLKKKTVVVGNPINLTVIYEKAGECPSDRAEQNDLVFLGRLSHQKNPFLFLKIVKELKRKIPNLQAAVIGDGELRIEFEKKIKEYGLCSTVKMYGFKENPYPYLNKSKVMCMPSLWEGFGLAAMEALTLGKPVVAAPVGGLVMIVNESCGSLCSDLDEYVSELYRLLTDEKYYEKKSKGAIKRAEELDNIQRYRKTIWNIYRSVTGVK